MNPYPTLESVQANIAGTEGCTFAGRVTILCVHMGNGHIVVGKSICASADTFNEELGLQLAMENAMTQAHELEVYAWRERCAAEEAVAQDLKAAGLAPVEDKPLVLFDPSANKPH